MELDERILFGSLDEKTNDPKSDLGINLLSVTNETTGNMIRTMMAIKIEPRREKTGFLHMRKQRRRSASRLPRS